MSDYQLGDRVTMTGTARKIKEYPKVFYKESVLPYRDNYPERKTYTEGVVVGSRTVQEGYCFYDEGYGFKPTMGTAERVWLIAYDLRMKPVMCFGHQISPKETGK